MKQIAFFILISVVTQFSISAADEPTTRTFSFSGGAQFQAQIAEYNPEKGTITLLIRKEIKLSALSDADQKILGEAYSPPMASESSTSISSYEAADLLKKIKANGLYEEMDWHKSNFDGEWLCQYRCYNSVNSGEGLSLSQMQQERRPNENFNELNCELLGDSSGTLYTVSIEAEICDPHAANRTLKHGAKLIQSLFPDCPEAVLNAFEAKTPFESGVWTVKRSDHNAGTDIVFLRK